MGKKCKEFIRQLPCPFVKSTLLVDCEAVGMGAHGSVQLESPGWGVRCCQVVPGEFTQGSAELEQETGKTEKI